MPLCFWWVHVCVCLMPSAMILAFVPDMYMDMIMCSVCASFGMLWKLRKPQRYTQHLKTR